MSIHSHTYPAWTWAALAVAVLGLCRIPAEAGKTSSFRTGLGKLLDDSGSVSTLNTGLASSGGVLSPVRVGGLFAEKIIGGSIVSVSLFPYMASISIVKGKSYDQLCGATILDKLHILTAAHCFSGSDTSKKYVVRAGSKYWRYRGQTRKVARFTRHPKYNDSTLDYDVAVVTLSKPLVFGSTVKPVKLVKVKSTIKPGTSITLLGWGYTDAPNPRSLSARLRSVKISTIAQTECEDDYAEYSEVVTARMFCSLGINKDSCQGDSGGPVIDTKSGEQLGVISWGMGCAQMGSPGVNTALANSAIRDFIDQAIKK